MSKTVTTNKGPSQAAWWSGLSTTALVALVCAAGLLAAFVVLPWLSEPTGDVTALQLLVSGGALPVSEGLVSAARAQSGALLLIPLAAVLALVGALWSPANPRLRRWTQRLIWLGGLVGLLYFILYGLADRQNTALAMIEPTGGGFWLAFFASALLALENMLVRSPASARVAPAEGYTETGFWRQRLGGLLDNPRFIRGVNLIFRFQSFFGLIIVFLLAIIFSPVRNDTNLFLSQRNLSNVARDVAETGVLAIGQILVIIIGGIDLSVGSVVALAATGVAFMLMRDLMPVIPAIMLILGMGLAIGWWNGWTSERFKIPSFVTTLAMLSIARGVAHIWSSDIAVPISYGQGGADPLFEIIGMRINGVFPVPAVIMFIIGLIMALVLHYTAFGRHLYAIGGNQTAARLSGLAVTRIKITAFMLCSFFASIAGVMHAAQLNQGSPNEAVGYELNAIAAVVIGGASLSGGKGTVVGAIAGAFILGILDNMLSLNNVNSNVQLVTKGLLVIAAVGLQQLRPRSAE